MQLHENKLGLGFFGGKVTFGKVTVNRQRCSLILLLWVWLLFKVCVMFTFFYTFMLNIAVF